MTRTPLTPRSQRSSWTDRAHRAIPRLEVPSLRTLDIDVARSDRRLRALLLARPIVGAALTVATVVAGWWLLVPAALWFHYGSTASAIHHLIHGSLGLNPRVRRTWLTVLGLLILESAHAWQATHVMHHRDGSDLPDPEGYLEYLRWRELPLGAFRWRYRMAAWGWRHGRRRRRTTLEIAAIAVATVTSVLLAPVTVLPVAYVALMQVGTFLFAVLLAKGPQTNFGRPTGTPLVMVRARLVGLLLFNHHLHLEHHAYPKVPLARLRHLTPVVEAALADEDVHHVRLAA